jgi:2Fe-2S ferredoxin
MSDIIQITVIDREGERHALEAPTDLNLNVMEICKAAELPIEGTCGGMALCASCHVYIESEHDVFERSEDEEDMLDQAFFVNDKSRLCCQMNIKNDMDGLVVKLAAHSN